MQRRSLEGDACPVARSLNVIGDWWSLLIIRDALSGMRRFGEFQQNTGIAKNILTARLRKLVEHGVLKVAPASDGSAYQEYVLTDKGRALHTVIVAIWQWGASFAFSPQEVKPALIDRQSGQQITPIEVRAKSGQLVEPGDATTGRKGRLDGVARAARRR